MLKPSYVDFDHKTYKKRLEKYSLKAEIGVLSYGYSKQINKYWKFKDARIALKSSQKLYQILKYNLLIASQSKDKKTKLKYFIRADICRKFIQMGFTRSMRYYYHKSGKKWGKKNGKWIILPYDYDYEKKDSADIFKKYLKKVRKNKLYIEMKTYFIENY